ATPPRSSAGSPPTSSSAISATSEIRSRWPGADASLCTRTGGARPMARVKPPRAPAKAGAKYQLRLYLAGQSARSIAALTNLHRICDAHLAGQYEIEVIDLLEQPQLAK